MAYKNLAGETIAGVSNLAKRKPGIPNPGGSAPTGTAPQQQAPAFGALPTAGGLASQNPQAMALANMANQRVQAPSVQAVAQNPMALIAQQQIGARPLVNRIMQAKTINPDGKSTANLYSQQQEQANQQVQGMVDTFAKNPFYDDKAQGIFNMDLGGDQKSWDQKEAQALSQIDTDTALARMDIQRQLAAQGGGFGGGGLTQLGFLANQADQAKAKAITDLEAARQAAILQDKAAMINALAQFADQETSTMLAKIKMGLEKDAENWAKSTDMMSILMTADSNDMDLASANDLAGLGSVMSGLAPPGWSPFTDQNTDYDYGETRIDGAGREWWWDGSGWRRS